MVNSELCSLLLHSPTLYLLIITAMTQKQSHSYTLCRPWENLIAYFICHTWSHTHRTLTLSQPPSTGSCCVGEIMANPWCKTTSVTYNQPGRSYTGQRRGNQKKSITASTHHLSAADGPPFQRLHLTRYKRGQRKAFKTVSACRLELEEEKQVRGGGDLSPLGLVTKGEDMQSQM